MVLLPKPSNRRLPDWEQTSHRWMRSALHTPEVFDYARQIGTRTKDSAWFKRWDEHFWGLLWIHCNPRCVPRAIAKIKSNRAKALLVLMEKVWEDDRMVRLQDDLQRMTLNSYDFLAGQSIHQDAGGKKLGNTPDRTTVVYVDGSLLDEWEADIRMVARVVAEPMRYMFAAPSQEADQYTEGRDDLTTNELDAVVGYMHNPMHDIMSAKRSKEETKWWEDDSIASAAFDGNAFVRRVLDHWADQDEPRGGNPPTYGDIYRTKCGIHRPSGASKDPCALDLEQDQVHLSQDTHVKSMLQVPTKAKAFAYSDPRVQALREKIKADYAKNFFSGKPTKDPPIRGAYGEAKISLRHPHKVFRQREFALKGDWLEAMKAMLKEFMQRGWLETCTSEWASPAFVVPKKVAGEWRLVVDYRGLNKQTEFDSYTLPLIEDMLQRQHGRRLFMVIDLKHGYHQMPLAPESRACTAMSTPLGPLQWK